MDHDHAIRTVNDRGGTGVLVAGVLLPVAVVGVVLVAALGRLAVGRTAVQAAADAAALAAAPATFAPLGGPSDPGQAAGDVARKNGARLVSCACAVDRTWAPRTVVVEVAADTAIGPFEVELRAAAAAEFTPVDLLR